jgi:hypothetical protein
MTQGEIWELPADDRQPNLEDVAEYTRLLDAMREIYAREPDIDPEECLDLASLQVCTQEGMTIYATKLADNAGSGGLAGEA